MPISFFTKVKDGNSTLCLVSVEFNFLFLFICFNKDNIKQPTLETNVFFNEPVKYFQLRTVYIDVKLN